MQVAQVVRRAHEVLVPDGHFLAEEPICLLRLVRWLHRRCPFHPAPHTEDERELNGEDLRRVRSVFRRVTISYHDFLVRESVAHCLSRVGLGGLLGPLGRVDAVLMNLLVPWLRYLGSYVLIHAVK
jgi:hypothetical protein